MTTERKRKRGRPPLPEGEAMSDVIVFRVKAGDREIFTEAADRCELVLADWIRWALFDSAEHDRRPK